MNRGLGNGHGRLLNRFGQGGVRVDGPRQVLGAAAVFQVRDDLADQFGSAVAQDLSSQDLVGLRIGDDLDETFRRIVRQGAAIGGEVEFSDLEKITLKITMQLFTEQKSHYRSIVLRPNWFNKVWNNPNHGFDSAINKHKLAIIRKALIRNRIFTILKTRNGYCYAVGPNNPFFADKQALIKKHDEMMI